MYEYLNLISLVVSILTNIKYSLGRSGGDRVGFTPFTGNIIILFVYWGILHLLQLSFTVEYYYNKKKLDIKDALSNHLVLFNLLQFIWIELFAHKYYILAELIVIINFLNIVVLYNSLKTYKIKELNEYFLVHFSVTALPFSWLLYALFWNGAVVVGSNSLAARIVANVFIWDFLLVPGFNLVVFRDWAVGLSSSLIVLALAFGQLFTKLFALQWIFAFVISGLLFLSSVAVWSSKLKNNSETAPLIT